MIENLIIFFKSDYFFIEKLMLSFFFGSTIGSFLNVLIYRIPIKKSILKSSSCPNCNKKILFFFNIPIFGFILTKGKCFYCKKKIDISYFKIEIIFGLFSLLAFLIFDLNYQFLILNLFFCFIYFYIRKKN